MITLFVFSFLLAASMAMLIALGMPAVGIPLGVVAISLLAIAATMRAKARHG